MSLPATRGLDLGSATARTLISGRAGVLPRPEPIWLSGDGAIDGRTGITERSLPDGRSFRIVKRFFDPDELSRQLTPYGIDARVTTTAWAFLLGQGFANPA